MPLSSEDFYLDSCPSSLQQGDIADGVPLLLLPDLDRLILIRSTHRNYFVDHLDPGVVNLVDEMGLNDAFDRGFEYAAVAVRKGMAILITPTCDLDAVAKAGGVWQVWPIQPLKDSGLDKGNLFAGKYETLFGFPEHRNFDDSFVDVTDVRSIRPQHFPAKDRVASTTRTGQDEMMDKFSKAFGRTWGYAEGEKIEALAKHEVEKFRCARCNTFDMTLSDPIPLKAGEYAPKCDNCAKLGKAAQWYPLKKYRKG